MALAHSLQAVAIVGAPAAVYICALMFIFAERKKPLKDSGVWLIWFVGIHVIATIGIASAASQLDSSFTLPAEISNAFFSGGYLLWVVLFALLWVKRILIGKSTDA